MTLHSDEDLHLTRDLLGKARQTLTAQQEALLQMGATPAQAERALDPMRCFMGDLEDQIAAYETRLRKKIEAAPEEAA